jgi:acyl carrier protein
VTSLDPSNEASMIPRIGDLVARVMKNPGLATRITASTDLVNEIGLDSLQMIDSSWAWKTNSASKSISIL